MRESRQRRWSAGGVKAFRRHLGLSQERLARELGTRQQTISEWETGVYAPSGISSTLLSILAERADFQYEAGSKDQEKTGAGQANE